MNPKGRAVDYAYQCFYAGDKCVLAIIDGNKILVGHDFVFDKEKGKAKCKVCGVEFTDKESELIIIGNYINSGRLE